MLSPYGSGRRCAVLGSPIAHSLSPALHRAAYAALGLDWTYTAVEVPAGRLAEFVRTRDQVWRGLSVTMPLKAEALALGGGDELSARVGGANTVLLEPDGVRVRNTDVPGMLDALRRAEVDGAGTVTVLGAGVTAASALAAVEELGARAVSVVARTPARAESLRDVLLDRGIRFSVVPWGPEVPRADLLVSTVAAGVADSLGDAAGHAAPVVFDVVYDGWPTPLGRTAAAAGARVVGGLDLLVYQAVHQVRLMTGLDVDADVLRSAGEAALAAPD